MENYVAQRYIENPYLIGGEMAALAQNSVSATLAAFTILGNVLPSLPQ